MPSRSAAQPSRRLPGYPRNPHAQPLAATCTHPDQTSTEKALPTPTEDAEHLSRLTLRLPAGEMDQLREAAYRARVPMAALARALVLRALAEGELPPPAPPALAEMSPEAQELLAVAHALISNLSQLEKHALELGEPVARLAGDGGQLDVLRNKVRELGMIIKSGHHDAQHWAGILVAIKAPSLAINSLARSLNQSATSVPAYSWHGPLSGLRSALERI